MTMKRSQGASSVIGLVGFLTVAVATSVVVLLPREGESAAIGAGSLPPPALWNSPSLHAIVRGHQSGEVLADTLGRKVAFHWMAWSENGTPIDWTTLSFDHDGMMGSHNVSHDVQAFGVRYHPTVTSALGDDRVVVAGANALGETIIEVWSLEWPAAMPSPYIDPLSGLDSVAVARPELSSVDLLYSDDIPGMQHVRAIVGMKSDQVPGFTGVLVQFDDSRDVYAFSLDANAPPVLVASPNSGAGALLVIPELSQLDYDVFGGSSAPPHGYVYLLGVGRTTGETLVALIDGDKNGVIDSSTLINASQWESQGWSNANNMLEEW